MHARFSKLMRRDSGFTQTGHNPICVVAHGFDQQPGIRRSNIYFVPHLSRTDSGELDQTAPEELSDQSLPCLPFRPHPLGAQRGKATCTLNYFDTTISSNARIFG